MRIESLMKEQIIDFLQKLKLNPDIMNLGEMAIRTGIYYKSSVELRLRFRMRLL
jgi:hypothetical protein